MSNETSLIRTFTFVIVTGTVTRSTMYDCRYIYIYQNSKAFDSEWEPV